MKNSSLLILILLVSACNNPYPEYKVLGDDVYFQLLELGEGNNKVCTSYQSVISYKLGLLRQESQGYDYWNDYTFQNVSNDALANGNLGEYLCEMSEGDHAKLLFQYSKLKDSYLNEYEIDSIQIADSTMMFLDIEILTLYSEEEYQEILDEKYRIGILEENEYLKEYLSSEGLLDEYSFQEDVYWLITDSTSGIKLTTGMDLALDYRGFFLNGTEFDNTTIDSTSLYFQMGKPDQVIRGLEIVLSHMKEGERARVFVPSHKAFGKRGSTTGIVKENTPVCFDLYLKEIY